MSSNPVTNSLLQTNTNIAREDTSDFVTMFKVIKRIAEIFFIFWGNSSSLDSRIIICFPPKSPNSLLSIWEALFPQN